MKKISLNLQLRQIGFTAVYVGTTHTEPTEQLGIFHAYLSLGLPTVSTGKGRFMKIQVFQGVNQFH